MKKVPIIFSLLLFSCTEQRQITSTDQPDINKYRQPYHIFAIGQWNPGHVILTLTDNSNHYFIVKAEDDRSFKRGDIYKP